MGVDFGHTVVRKQAVTQMRTLDVASHLLNGYLSASHWISQTLVSSSIRREEYLGSSKGIPFLPTTVIYKVSHLLSLNDEMQMRSKEVSPSFSNCMAKALNTSILSGAAL